MSTPRRDVERNREAIVSAAMQVLSETPDATIGEVAKVSGVGRSTLYRHFADRDALVEAIVDRLLDESDAIITAHVEAAGDDPVEALVAVAEALAALGDRYGFIEAEQTRRYARRSSGRQRRAQLLLDVVTDGQRAGTVRADLPATWLTAMLGHAIGEAADRRAPGLAARRAALAPTIRSLMAPPLSGT